MDRFNKVDFLEKNLDRQLEWINRADSKAGFLFAIYSAIAGFFSTQFSSYISPNVKSLIEILISPSKWDSLEESSYILFSAICNLTFLNWLWIICVAFFFIAMVKGYYNIFLIVNPRLKSPEDSLIFFGLIAKKSYTDFGKRVNAVDEKEYIEDLTSQTYTNAYISTKKFSNCSLAFKYLRHSIIFFLILFLISFLQGL